MNSLTIEREFLIPAKLPGPLFTYIFFISLRDILFFFKNVFIKIVILSKLIFAIFVTTCINISIRNYDK